MTKFDKAPAENAFSDIKRRIWRHVAKENHVINWSGAKILEREGHRKTRQVKESIWIRKEPACMNKDGGAYVQLTDSL